MKTGYFYQKSKNKIDGAVSIAVGSPRYVKVNHTMKALAPTWGLLNAFRNDEIDEAEYVVRFNKQLSELDAKQVVADLQEIADSESDEVVIMCHCSPKDFCHRHLVAEWIERETGIKMEEYGMGAVERKDGRIVQKQVVQNQKQVVQNQLEF